MNSANSCKTLFNIDITGCKIMSECIFSDSNTSFYLQNELYVFNTKHILLILSISVRDSSTDTDII